MHRESFLLILFLTAYRKEIFRKVPSDSAVQCASFRRLHFSLANGSFDLILNALLDGSQRLEYDLFVTFKVLNSRQSGNNQPDIAITSFPTVKV
jgi:hypothetical protein